MQIPSLRIIILALLAMGVIGGSIDVAVVAFANAQGWPSAASFILAAYALGSLVAGLTFGALRIALPIERQFIFWILVTAGTALLPILSPNVYIMAGMLFIVATDTDQLCHSITSVYGDNFDSGQYLKRFFNRKSSLSAPDISSYISLKVNSSFDSNYPSVSLYPDHKSNCHNFERLRFNISKLSEAYNLKIRDVDQLLDKLSSCLRSISELGSRASNTQHLNIVALITGLIEQDLNLESYYTRKDFNPAVTEPKNNFQLSTDLDVNKYIRLNLETTILRENYYPDDPRGKTYNSPPMRDYYANLRNSQNSPLNSFFIFSLEGQTDNYNESNRKYWLWPDMKKLIELAGTLE
ncbi:hypothetical protein [Aeromonas bestiarum]|uniref:hypothetical protein n=1 Tax=Aeromonas bestiarum TaxID=105751 RepID=UPI0032B268D5